MKKVLFVATIANHIVGFHTKFLKLFKDNGYVTNVVVGDDKDVNNFCDKKMKISLFRNPFNIKNIIGIFQLKKIIETEKYDIIHCHTPMGGVVTRLAAMTSKKKYGVKVIYTSHGFHFYKGAPLINWILYYPVEWFLAKYTDIIITINKEDFELAKKKFSKRCKNIEYVPGVGIDVSKFDFQMNKNEIEDYRESIGLKKDDFVLIFPARLDKNKNQLLLIKIIEELLNKYKNVHLLLPGRDELNGYYQDIVHRKGLVNNIHFLGYRTDIAKLIKISNLGVSSSKREGLGLNLIEEIYCGIPVIAFNNRGHRDIINIDNGFIVNSKTEFVKYIEKIMLDMNHQYNIDVMKKSISKFQEKYVINEMKRIYGLKK